MGRQAIVLNNSLSEMAGALNSNLSAAETQLPGQVPNRLWASGCS
jgi:hypothetical protein